MSSLNLWLIFLTGLTTGGISCLAMQGGLLAGIIANQKKQDLHTQAKAQAEEAQTPSDLPDWMPVALFLGTKLIVHIAFGFLLGALGSVLSLSQPVQLLFQFLAALFMLATAANLLNLHPVFRYVVFQPPKCMQRWVRRSGKSSALFSPAILGFMTIFIPCGVTQAMEVLAITSGNPVQGALIMAAFVLGTIPVFAAIGIATSRFSDSWRTRFLRFAAVALIIMGVWGLNGVAVVLGSPVTLQKVGAGLAELGQPPSFTPESNGANVNIENGVQKVVITVGNSGYSPRTFTVKAGQPVELTLVSNESSSCANAFTLREFGIKIMLKATDRQSFTFTPEKPGKYTYTCSMGMYTGEMKVE